MTEFLGINPTSSDYWRSIILFGKNVACYKFALSLALLELALQGKTIVTLEDLAEPYSRYVVEHLKLSDAQSQDSSTPYPFLEAARQYLKSEISHDELLTITIKEGFKVVLDKFHNVNGELPIRFYFKGKGGLTITDHLLGLLETEQFQNLPQEIEARWRLVETAWKLKISRHSLQVNYDHAHELIFINDRHRRVNLTSCRDALNGYQKGKCFYCSANISISRHALDLGEIEHFFPRTLIDHGFTIPIDGVWNLVLACQTCNRGIKGKSTQLPESRFLERLHNRNEFLINSHHPLRETLILQTGKTEAQRINFLLGNYREAATGVLINSRWKPVYEHPPAF